MENKTYYHRPDIDLPGYLNKRPGKDAGYDLFALKDMWFLPMQTRKVESNVHYHILDKHFGFVASRSGAAIRGWLTHTGVVDHGYSGNVAATLTNLSLLPRRVKRGERIAQLVFVPFSSPELEEISDIDRFKAAVEYFSDSDRREKAYHSSGR